MYVAIVPGIVLGWGQGPQLPKFWPIPKFFRLDFDDESLATFMPYSCSDKHE